MGAWLSWRRWDATGTGTATETAAETEIACSRARFGSSPCGSGSAFGAPASAIDADGDLLFNSRVPGQTQIVKCVDGARLEAKAFGAYSTLSRRLETKKAFKILPHGTS